MQLAGRRLFNCLQSILLFLCFYKMSLSLNKTYLCPRTSTLYMLFTGHFHDRGQVSPYPDRARPVNNVFIFLCAILNQIHTKFQCCELDLRSVVFVTLLQVWLTTNSQDNHRQPKNSCFLS